MVKTNRRRTSRFKNRYEFIGGLSPLAGTTDRQAKALTDALNKTYDDVEFKLYLGLKHISPYIEEAVEKCIMMVLQRLLQSY